MPVPEHSESSLLHAPSFNKERHIKYWLRCLKTLLPTGYTPYDANRMMLAAWIVSALDLLSALDDRTTPEERQGYVDWIYSCQHPDGGFRAFNGTDTSKATEIRVERANGLHSNWDPANVAGTFFALCGLMVLGDDLKRVRRRKTLQWLQRLQLEDGSFAEVGSSAGPLGSGQDVRFCFLAVLVRWALRDEKLDEDVRDVDTTALTRFMLASQSYDGGFAKAPYHEPHAGWTYCAISALSLLGKLDARNPHDGLENGSCISEEARAELLRWLASRQVSFLYEYEDLDDGLGNDEEKPNDSIASETGEHGFSVQQSMSAEQSDLTRTRESLVVNAGDCLWAGFNGRCNKPSDTCYSFWVGGALAVLGRLDVIDAGANRRYLLDKTQHLIGGFGKLPGDPPDILHSYLGLAALSIMGEPDLKPLDPTLCISTEVAGRLEFSPWRKP